MLAFKLLLALLLAAFAAAGATHSPHIHATYPPNCERPPAAPLTPPSPPAGCESRDAPPRKGACS